MKAEPDFIYINSGFFIRKEKQEKNIMAKMTHTTSISAPPTRRKILHRLKKALILAAKIGLGSALAIYIAEVLGLANPAAAGTVTLLTLVNTKRGTVELILRRFLSFIYTLALCFILFYNCADHYIAFGIFLILVVFITEVLKWSGTLSVNALIGMHFMMADEITLAFALNELELLCIGVVLAFVLNLFNNYKSTRQHISEGIRHTDLALQDLLQDIALYIRNEPHIHPWRKLKSLEKEIRDFRAVAQEFQDDTFSYAPQCFVDYFDMRQAQFVVLSNLHIEIRRIRTMPVQAEVVADYVEYLIPYILDHNNPRPQLEKLESLLDSICQDYQMASRQDFEDRAILYHILMDLQDFLTIKAKFLDRMDEDQRELFFRISAHAVQTESQTA